MQTVGSPQEGDECDPSNLPDNVSPGLTCQPTDDEFLREEPFVANAEKGDLLLVANCGMIGGLLRAIDPPQFYSHEAIMTKNFYELRHSTSAEDRYKDWPNDPGIFTGDAPTDGIMEHAMRFGWMGSGYPPGAPDGFDMLQTVDQAFNGVELRDPDNNLNTYRIDTLSTAIARCKGDPKVSPMLVVK